MIGGISNPFNCVVLFEIEFDMELWCSNADI